MEGSETHADFLQSGLYKIPSLSNDEHIWGIPRASRHPDTVVCLRDESLTQTPLYCAGMFSATR